MRRVRTISILPAGCGWKVCHGNERIDLSFADLGTAIDAAGALCDDEPLRIVVLDRAVAAARAAA